MQYHLCKWECNKCYVMLCYSTLSSADNEERNRQMKNLEDLQRELAQMKRKLNDASSKCKQR